MFNNSNTVFLASDGMPARDGYSRLTELCERHPMISVVVFSGQRELMLGALQVMFGGSVNGLAEIHARDDASAPQLDKKQPAITRPQVSPCDLVPIKMRWRQMPTEGAGNPKVPRRLAAILAADIVGYSALMGADEARTVSDLKGHQAVVLPMIAQFGGRIIDTAGDGILAEFGSVVNAVECAVAIQETMAKRNADIEQQRRMQYRIGINQGDVVFDDTRVYGDGVNIAARLEAIAVPGAICISGKVYEDIQGKILLAYEDIGEQQLKNIARPIHVYRVRLDETGKPVRALALPDRPSIAVLPFNNMSGDPEQEYFADGMVEDITMALSRIRWLFVIARSSSFTYKGRAVDVKQVGRELGVRYVLEGSVRMAASRVRISGQLIDASTGANLWADRFEGELADMFDLQDHMTTSVLGAIAPKLEQAEIERAQRKPIGSLDAYDYYLRGRHAP
jgi:TolB-like protein/class 3 adenylate cyclase